MTPPALPKRRMHVVLKLMIGFGVLLILIVAAFAIWRTRLASANAKRFKAIQSAGEPATARELDAWYARVEPAENAASVWLAGIDKLQPPYEKNTQRPWEQIKAPARGAQFDAPELKRATDVLAQNREALA